MFCLSPCLKSIHAPVLDSSHCQLGGFWNPLGDAPLSVFLRSFRTRESTDQGSTIGGQSEEMAIHKPGRGLASSPPDNTDLAFVAP